MNKFLLSLIPAVLVSVIAVLSVQNAELIALNFLTFRSVALPFGLWIGFGLALGMLGMASFLTLSSAGRR